MGDLSGKVAIVTGAGRGLGKEEAIQLAKQGASVVINDINLPDAVEADTMIPVSADEAMNGRLGLSTVPVYGRRRDTGLFRYG